MTSFTASSIRYNEELNCWFFALSVWRRLWEMLIIQAIFPSDKGVPWSTRWKQRTHLSQMLCNNNKSKRFWPMWKNWLAKMKNCERQWNPKTQNVGEQVKNKMKKSQTLKPTDKTVPQEKIPPGWRTNFATWGRRWRNWKMLWRTKAERIWMGWFEGRTHHSLLKYWTVPFHQNSVSYSWSRMTVPTIPWITSNHSRHWCHCRWPQTRWCVGYFQQH